MTRGIFFLHNIKMSLGNIFELDFFVYLGLWTGFIIFLFKTKQDPIKLKNIKDPVEREKQRNLYITNFGSLLHAILIIVFGKQIKKLNFPALICILIYDHEYYRGLYFLESIYMKISLSYFIVDTIGGFYKDYNDIWMNAHHFLMMFTLALALYM